MNDETLPIWTFNIGAAAINYHVYAKDSAEAYRVACAWCKQTGKRQPAAVQPFIVAGPEILMEKPEVSAELPTPTEATSGSFMDRARAAIIELGGR